MVYLNKVYLGVSHIALTMLLTSSGPVAALVMIQFQKPPLVRLQTPQKTRQAQPNQQRELSRHLLLL